MIASNVNLIASSVNLIAVSFYRIDQIGNYTGVSPVGLSILRI